ncbi:hypothetical protein SCHPADRAFT_939323 [Schizopora paradoxa]|uniref:Glucose receptor Git3 N-terminal domain-containing protein n=1 Tax=Schizopora paradoxa TaxID=27342 RepID=A0A0H2RRM2_9AGAM|nr:hypothetical protein SCHPADRAFT_939323 [Schizopora paradoxa]
MPNNGDCPPTILSRTDSVGLAFVVEAGILSATSLTLAIVLIIRNVLRYKKFGSAYRWNLVEVPADVYVLSLLFGDVLQAVGTSMSAKWVREGNVTPGPYCTAQGVVKQLGETSVGLATMVIAVHTFVTVWMRKRYRVRIAVLIVAVYWIFIILYIGISSGEHRNYVEPSPFWCWVGPDFAQDRIWGEYFWLWLTLFVSFAVYVPLFLWNQGYLSIDEKHWWKVHWYRTPFAEEAQGLRRRPTALSLKLLAYPVAYSIIVLPLSIVRWLAFTSKPGCGRSSVPSAATFITVFLHGCFGFVNVVLLLTTRQTLLLFDDPRNPSRLRFRHATGTALAEWDDEARAGDAGSLKKRVPKSSKKDTIVGLKRVASLDSIREVPRIGA